MSGLTVSVIVPAWNEARRLPRLLDALARCSPSPDEVIVVDGGSSDGTAGLGRGRARVITSERGRARQQNAGARAATGAVLWFLHADSIPPPDAIGQIRSALDRGAPGGCFRIAFPSAERVGHPLLRPVAVGVNARTRVTGRGTGDQGIYVRREVFEAIGGFPDWPLFEDVALASRLRRFGRPVVSAGPLETSARRWIGQGIVRTTLLMWALRAGYLLGVSPTRLARRWRHAPPE
ncbi:MAG TPA: TIGR04283 family arsenosugar biosynthesis glycosyltransferase [Gemmatimonadota bacterium]|nr:TIGR04283 family arsenosugar biosynthesis glycosyltransferase [Gemmatimonadota bacterium]